MAFPAESATDARSRVEIADPSLDPVAPQDVDSGADIANRATLAATTTYTRGSAAAEMDGAVSGNETALAVLESYYRNPEEAAERLKELTPDERDALRGGDLSVLGEVRPEAETSQSLDGIDRDDVGPGLAAFGKDQSMFQSRYAEAQDREQDRATGREPAADLDLPGDVQDTDTNRDRESGQSPSRGGQAGVAAREVQTVEETMERQAISMSPSL